MSISENVAAVKERIAEAARAAGRDSGEILLCAATKQNSAENVRLAVQAGIDIAGENRVDELVEKNAQLAYESVPLHFIGHLQRNKAKFVVGVADIIQSADSVDFVSTVDRLAKAKGIVQKLLVEVNIGCEASKSGVAPENLDRFLEECAGFSNVSIQGLMAIPPIAREKDENRRFFSRMYKLFVDMSAKKYDNNVMRHLSMGMSGDFESAILEGANIVRVGTAIFGSRKY